MTHDLRRETEAAKTLRAQLRDIIGDDQELAADMVEAETDLHEAIGDAIGFLVSDSAAIIGLDDMIKKLKARQDRIAARIETMRVALSVALTQAGRKTFEHPCATISLKAVPAKVIVTDETVIPSKYWKMEPKLDKQAIKSDLKDKQDIPGTQLSNGGETIQVRFT